MFLRVDLFVETISGFDYLRNVIAYIQCYAVYKKCLKYLSIIYFSFVPISINKNLILVLRHDYRAFDKMQVIHVLLLKYSEWL